MARDETYVVDILESARLISTYIAGKQRDDLDHDVMLQDALCRRFEIIGEATKRLSETYRDEHPQVAWKAMAGMRDIIIHEYDVIDLDLLWDTATESIPPLIAQLEQIIGDNA